MLKKMLVVVAILLVASTAFGAWSASKFSTSTPQPKIPDPCDATKLIDNPAYADFDKVNYGTDRTVDWEVDGNSMQRKGESWNWPATYDYVPICDIRVQMDIGFWIRINGCRDNIIKLKQRKINEYGGFTTCTAFTNVATQWKADFIIKTDGIDWNGWQNSWKWDAAVDPSTFDKAPGGKSINIKLRMWDVDLSKLPAGTNCLDIGVVRVSVRPTVKANSFITNACGGKYPVYAPPKDELEKDSAGKYKIDDNGGKGFGYDPDVTWW